MSSDIEELKNKEDFDINAAARIAKRWLNVDWLTLNIYPDGDSKDLKYCWNIKPPLDQPVTFTWFSCGCYKKIAVIDQDGNDSRWVDEEFPLIAKILGELSFAVENSRNVFNKKYTFKDTGKSWEENDDNNYIKDLTALSINSTDDIENIILNELNSSLDKNTKTIIETDFSFITSLKISKIVPKNNTSKERFTL